MWKGRERVKGYPVEHCDVHCDQHCDQHCDEHYDQHQNAYWDRGEGQVESEGVGVGAEHEDGLMKWTENENVRQLGSGSMSDDVCTWRGMGCCVSADCTCCSCESAADHEGKKNGRENGEKWNCASSMEMALEKEAGKDCRGTSF